MKRTFRAAIVSAAFLAGAAFQWPSAVAAFQGEGCMGECADCHSITKEEAGKLLKTERFKAAIKDIRISPVKGLWEVEIAQGDKLFIVYVDFAKKFLVEGKFTPLAELGESAPLKKIDLSRIPLDGALVMGDPKADKKVVIFDDPDCPYCAKLHDEVKKILSERKDIAFYIKLYPLPSHPDAYDKSRTIVCKKSVKLLEDAFAGKKLPKPDCNSTEVDDNIKLAEELGIMGTPMVMLPDGRVLPGYVPAEVITGLIDGKE